MSLIILNVVVRDLVMALATTCIIFSVSAEFDELAVVTSIKTLGIGKVPDDASISRKKKPINHICQQL